MEKNLALRCFYRDQTMLQEEFSGGAEGVARVGRDRWENPKRNSIGYTPVPQELRKSPYSVMLNCPSTLSTPGVDACLQPGSRCVPAYRSALLYK
jgi:hypothetical protein